MKLDRKASDFYSEAGSPVRQLFAGEVQPDGQIVLVPAGTQDIHDYIESFTEETNIYNILARYRRGDVDALNVRQGAYGDFTDLPKTRAEFLQQLIDANRLFDNLTDEQKDAFDRDPMKYFVQAGSEDWMKKLGMLPAEVKNGETPVESIKNAEDK